MAHVSGRCRRAVRQSSQTTGRPLCSRFTQSFAPTTGAICFFVQQRLLIVLYICRRTIDIAGLADSELFRQFELCAFELQTLDVAQLLSDDAVARAFYINVVR